MCLTALFIFAYVYYFIVVLQIYHKIPNNQKNSLFLKRLVSAFSNIEKIHNSTPLSQIFS